MVLAFINVVKPQRIAIKAKRESPAIAIMGIQLCQLTQNIATRGNRHGTLHVWAPMARYGETYSGREDWADKRQVNLLPGLIAHYFPYGLPSNAILHR